ncbi:MAG: FAD binding domain-containing protein, partial [Faecalibacillus sp.]
MLKIQKYTRVKNLDEAYTILNKNRNNMIIGGMMWLKMSHRLIPEAIDLSDLNLNSIEEKENEFQIGCMCTLRQLEVHQSLNQLCQNMIRDALCDIVGVQFRNMATIGGSLFSRFGFS